MDTLLPKQPLRITGTKETRINALERKVARLADALAFAMQMIQTQKPSPIVGVEPKTYTLAELYAEVIHTRQAQAEADQTTPSHEAEHAH